MSGCVGHHKILRRKKVTCYEILDGDSDLKNSLKRPTCQKIGIKAGNVASCIMCISSLNRIWDKSVTRSTSAT